MSAEFLPRWLRRFSAWGLTVLQRMPREHHLCVHCAARLPVVHVSPDLLWDTLVTCPGCGHVSPLHLPMMLYASQEEAMARSTKALPAEPTSNIEVTREPAQTVWHLKRKRIPDAISVVTLCAVLAFGNLVRVVFRGPIVLGIVVGTTLPFLPWIFKRFFFSSILKLDAVEVSLERQFLGFGISRKVLPRDAVADIHLAAPAWDSSPFVIELAGPHGRLVLGHALMPVDKRWLCQDIRRAFGQPGTGSLLAKHQNGTASGDTGRLLIKPHQGQCELEVAASRQPASWMIQGWVVLALGAIAFGFGLRGLLTPEDPNLPGGWVTTFSNVADAIWHWMLITGGSIILLISALVIWASRNAKHTRKDIRATTDTLRVTTIRGTQTSEQTWEAAGVKDVTLDVYERTGGKDLHQVSIVLKDRAVTFGAGLDARELGAAVAALRKVLLPDRGTAG